MKEVLFYEACKLFTLRAGNLPGSLMKVMRDSRSTAEEYDLATDEFIEEAKRRWPLDMAAVDKTCWVDAADVQRSARELDMLLNGVLRAAPSPALIDVVAQYRQVLPQVIHAVREYMAACPADRDQTARFREATRRLEKLLTGSSQ